MSKGFDMLRDYIEHDALCMRRRKCCDFEYELQQEFAALEAENEKLKALARDMYTCINHVTGTDAHWDCTACPLDGTRECDFEGRMITFDVKAADAPDDPPMSDAARRVFDRLMSELGGDSDESR